MGTLAPAPALLACASGAGLGVELRQRWRAPAEAQQGKLTARRNADGDVLLDPASGQAVARADALGRLRLSRATGLANASLDRTVKKLGISKPSQLVQLAGVEREVDVHWRICTGITR